jgi:hypothetical protein
MDNELPDDANGANDDLGLSTFSKAIELLADASDMLKGQNIKPPQQYK